MTFGVGAANASSGISGAWARMSNIQAQLATLTGTRGATAPVSLAAAPTVPSSTMSVPAAAPARPVSFAEILDAVVAVGAGDTPLRSAVAGVRTPPPPPSSLVLAQSASTASTATTAPATAPAASGVSSLPVGTVNPAPAIAVPTPSGGWVQPVPGRVTSAFGPRRHPVTGVDKLHAGADFAAASGTPISAASAGVVRSAGWRTGYGNTVEIEHGDGIRTRYAHAATVLVEPGQRVRTGEVIATAGSTGMVTGPHLHLEVRADNTPIDPVTWLREHAPAT